MITKKTIFFFIFFVLSTTVISLAQTNQNDCCQEFSEWCSHEKLNELIKSTLNDHYPIVIQAKSLLGDGVVYRVLFDRKPSSDFEYEYVFGVEGNEFNNMNEDFLKQGYILIHHQTEIVMLGPIHQAVWVKSIL